MFVDKQVIAVTVENMFLRSMGMLPFTCCEVYAPLGINTNVCTSVITSQHHIVQLPYHFRGVPSDPVVVKGTVVSLLPCPLEGAFAHFIEEGLARFA